jgi:transposase-like protein
LDLSKSTHTAPHACPTAFSGDGVTAPNAQQSGQNEQEGGLDSAIGFAQLQVKRPASTRLAQYRHVMPEIEKTILCAGIRGEQLPVIQATLRRQNGFHIPLAEIAAIRVEQLKTIVDWRSRRLASVYAAIYFGSIKVKVLDPTLRLATLHMAVGITCDGKVQFVGAWAEPQEGAQYQDRWMEELRACGMQDVLFVFVQDEHQADAIQKAFPLARSVRVSEKKTVSPEANTDTLPEWAKSLAMSSNPYSTLIARIRRGGLKAHTAFRGTDEALELLLVILRPETIAWHMRAKSWRDVEQSLYACFGQRLGCPTTFT